MVIRKPSIDFSRTMFCCTWEQMRDWRCLAKRIELHVHVRVSRRQNDPLLLAARTCTCFSSLNYILFLCCTVASECNSCRQGTSHTPEAPHPQLQPAPITGATGRGRQFSIL